MAKKYIPQPYYSYEVPDWNEYFGSSRPSRLAPAGSLLLKVLKHVCWIIVGSLLVIILEDRKVYRAVRDAIFVAGAKKAWDYSKQQQKKAN